MCALGWVIFIFFLFYNVKWSQSNRCEMFFDSEISFCLRINFKILMFFKKNPIFFQNKLYKQYHLRVIFFIHEIKDIVIACVTVAWKEWLKVKGFLIPACTRMQILRSRFQCNYSCITERVPFAPFYPGLYFFQVKMRIISWFMLY